MSGQRLDAPRPDSTTPAAKTVGAHAAEAQELFGHDFWPHGVEANLRTLEAFRI